MIKIKRSEWLKKSLIIIGISSLLIGISQNIYWYYFYRKLNKCKKSLSSCFVYETNYIYIKTSGLWVYYSYQIDGKSYRDRCNLGLDYEDELEQALLYKTFPLLYCNQSPGIGTPLITPKLFKEYGYYFPDSLKWVEDYKK